MSFFEKYDNKEHLWTRPTKNTILVLADIFHWLDTVPDNSFHAVVTDPPYGVKEFEEENLDKLESRKGGVWRKPPILDGHTRSPLPRFTVLTSEDRKLINTYFRTLAIKLKRVLVPGGHIVMASNPIVSSAAFWGVEEAGMEKRGEIVRIVKTLRGGDRPKGFEDEFSEVSVMPKSCHEPWGVFRKPLSEKTVAQNLRKWGTGGFRRISDDEPFRDLIECPPAKGEEKSLSKHPSMKPQRLMRQLVVAALPLGEGIILEPFSGSGSTLAAADRNDIQAVGVERIKGFYEESLVSIPRLSAFNITTKETT